MNRRRATCLCFLPVCLALLQACGQQPVPGNRFAETGSIAPARESRSLIRQYGCGACHRIPGVEGAVSPAAPPLDDISHQAYLGGVLPNTYDNMILWLMDPRAVNPASAMPDLDLTRADAETIAEYLYTL